MNKISKKLKNALIVGDKKELTKLLLKMEPADLTDFLHNLPTPKLTRLVKIVDFGKLAELLTRVSPQTSAELLTRVSREQAADVLEEMEPDEAADVLAETPAPFKRLNLEKMEKKARSEVRKLLGYPQQTAGAIMTPRFVAVTANATIEEALTVVRSLASELESIYYLYVLDDKDRLIGVLSLRALLLASSKAKVAEVMRKDIVAASVSEDQETAAEKVVDNELTAIPVIDKKGKLLGIITYDDAARVLEREASEDIERIGGAQPLDRPYLETSLIALFSKRIGWLFVLFFAQTLTGNVLSFFQNTLASVVALSFFIPLLIGTGGNIGAQTVSLMVRSIALGQVSFRNILEIITKEARTGIALGITLGIVGFIWAIIFTQNQMIALTVGITIVIISAYSASVGALIPLLLHRAKLDPATASTPFISTVVDASGLLIYFTIAKVFLGL